MDPILQNLIKILTQLPSLGPRSARRITLSLIKHPEMISKLISSLTQAKNSIKKCKICNNLSQQNVCEICLDDNRDQNQICIVENLCDLWAIERIGQFLGTYYILEESFSLANIINKDNCDLEKQLEARISEEPTECIIAMNPTIEGQATIHYLQSILKKYSNITITTLSLGIPMGSELDYLDNGTLTVALNSRKEID